MLKWREPLLVHPPGVEKKKVREEIEGGKVLKEYYLVTLSRVPGNRLEILPCALLWQRELRESLPMIIGLAKGRRAAIELAAQIVLDYDCFLPKQG